MKKAAKEIWIIFDPLDGPHIFSTQKQAEKTYARWAKEANGNSYDSYWDMSKPTKYVIANKDKQ
jgi:hypothetical protein